MARKNRNDATTVGLWAPIVDSGRTRWIVWTDVRTTRRAAREAYLEPFPPHMHKKQLARVKFARVTITEDF